MKHAPFDLVDTPNPLGTLGLIALQSDETIENDFRQIFPDPKLGLHVSRVPSGAELTQDSIAQMAVDLPYAASLLPPPVEFDVVGYACTSGSTLIGPDRVADLVRSRCNTSHVCTPITAAIAAMDHLGAKRIGYVAPYTEDVVRPMVRTFEEAGITISDAVTFSEESEKNVVRIAAQSLKDAAHSVARGADAIFLSCTNLRTLDIIEPLETELRIPVLSSNLCLAWDMARCAKTTGYRAIGRLFQTGL